MSTELNAYAYHLHFSSEFDIGRYIVNILQMHFIHLGNVHSVIFAHRVCPSPSNDENGENSHYLKFHYYNKYAASWEKNGNKIKVNGGKIEVDVTKAAENYKTNPFPDGILMGSFYKNALDNNSFLVITSKHNKSYKSLENKIKGCKVIDMDSVALYIKEEDEKRQHIEEFKNFELNYLFYKYNEAETVRDKKIVQWTSLLFPYFFLTEFVGLVTVVFEGELDVDSIEQYSQFLRKAQSLFYRSIIDSIIDEWVEKNKGKSIIEYIKYFFPLKPINPDSKLEDNLFNEFTTYFSEKEKNGNNEIKILIPSFHKNGNTYMPLLLNNENYYIDKPIEFIDQEMRSFAFDQISHIQWLWQRWISKEKKRGKNK